jgi:hypothetical protein
METITRRGAVAALFVLGVSAPLAAQATSVVRVQRDQRDSTEFRAVMMTKARLDSVMTLTREFSKLPMHTPEWEAMRARIDAMMPNLPGGRVMIRSNQGAPPAFPKGWIGINAQGLKSDFLGPDGYFVQYFEDPAIVSVDPDSPAQRAGITPGDVLLKYDGVDVKGHLLDLTQMLVPDKKLSVSVRHDGESKDYTLVVAPAPVQVFERRRLDGVNQAEIRVSRVITAAGDSARAVMMQGARGGGGSGGARAGSVVPLRSYFYTANGAFGAILSTVGPELAKTLKLDQGVLVTDITDETPASRSGLRPGDVIVSVGGQSVVSLKALQEAVAIRAAERERSVVLQVMRDKRPQKVTLSW